MQKAQKDLKKDFKKGYKAAIYLTDKYHYSWLSIAEDDKDEVLLKKYAKDVEALKERMFEGTKPIVFRPDSFNLTVDKAHPAPHIFM